MTKAESWMRERVQAAPQELFEAMLEALPADYSASVPEILAAGALVLYARVARGSGGREDALPLLAADALFTHAFQAQAEINPTAVGAFAHEWGGRGRLSKMVAI